MISMIAESTPSKLKKENEIYQNLAIELRICKIKVKVINVVISALSKTPKMLPTRLKEIGIETRIFGMQKSAILYSSRILGKILEIWGDLLPNMQMKYIQTKLACTSNALIIIT